MITNKDESDNLFDIMMDNIKNSPITHLSNPVVYAFFHDCVITRRCIDTVLDKPKSFINNTKQFMIPFRHRITNGTIPLLGIDHLRTKELFFQGSGEAKECCIKDFWMATQFLYWNMENSSGYHEKKIISRIMEYCYR